MKHLLFFILVFKLNLVCVHLHETGTTASLNNIIDEITANIKTSGKEIGLDSISIPDIYKEIKEGESVKKFNLTNGVVKNLNTIERYGDSTISYSSNILRISFQLHFTALKANFDFDIHAWNLHPIGTLEGAISDFILGVEANINAKNVNATLDKLEFPSTGKIDFSVKTTVPIYGYTVDALFITATIFQDIIVYETANVLRKKIDEALKNIFS